MRNALRRSACFLVALLIVACAAADGRAQNSIPSTVGIYSKSYALVIGVARYRSSAWPALRYARKDAEGVAALLHAQGFEVTALYDEKASAQAILSALEDNLAQRLRTQDRMLFFFSGHGHTQQLAGRDYGYIVPHDGGEGFASLISMETLRTLSEKMGAAKHQLFIMDACFGGQFAPTKSPVAALPRSHPRYIEEIARRTARQFLTAGGKDQQVLDGGPEGYSYFTGYLISALRDGLGDLDGDGYITTAELATYLVPKATNRFQTPGTGTLPGHGLGEFVFVAPAATRVARAAPAARPLPADLGIKSAAEPSPVLRSPLAAAGGGKTRAPKPPPDQLAAIPPAPAAAPGRALVVRAIESNAGEVRTALGMFLRDRNNIPNPTFGVQTVWGYEILRPDPRGFVVRFDYELNSSDLGPRLRTDEFVVTSDGRLFHVIDQLTSGN